MYAFCVSRRSGYIHKKRDYFLPIRKCWESLGREMVCEFQGIMVFILFIHIVPRWRSSKYGALIRQWGLEGNYNEHRKGNVLSDTLVHTSKVR